MSTPSPTTGRSRSNSFSLQEGPAGQERGSFIERQFNTARGLARSSCGCVERNPGRAMVAAGLPSLGMGGYLLSLLSDENLSSAATLAAIAGFLVMSSLGTALTTQGGERWRQSCQNPSDREDSTADAEDPDASGGERPSEELREVRVGDSDSASDGLQSLDGSQDSKGLPPQECDE
jgi:hypothetical protein